MNAPTPGGQSPNILAPILGHAARQPEKTLFNFYDADGRSRQSYSYSAFVRRTNDIATRLAHQRALEPGDPVILVYPPGIELLCAFFACVRLGCIRSRPFAGRWRSHPSSALAWRWRWRRQVAMTRRPRSFDNSK